MLWNYCKLGDLKSFLRMHKLVEIEKFTKIYIWSFLVYNERGKTSDLYIHAYNCYNCYCKLICCNWLTFVRSRVEQRCCWKMRNFVIMQWLIFPEDTSLLSYICQLLLVIDHLVQKARSSLNFSTQMQVFRHYSTSSASNISENVFTHTFRRGLLEVPKAHLISALYRALDTWDERIC